jgi:hypothetical protein
MSHRMLGMRRVLRIVRRRWTMVAGAGALGLIAGVGYAVASPPLLASQAVVFLTSLSPGAEAQVPVAHSDAVLSSAMRGVSPAVSLPTLRKHVRVISLTPRILSIRAEGATAIQAEAIANAVARSYIDYVRDDTSREQPAYLLDTAAAATGTPLAHRLVTFGGLGVLAGVLTGALAALVRRRPSSPLPEGSPAGGRTWQPPVSR